MRNTASKSYSLPQADRIRKKVMFTLSDEERERLRELAQNLNMPCSQVVAKLIMEAPRATTFSRTVTLPGIAPKTDSDSDLGTDWLRKE